MKYTPEEVAKLLKDRPNQEHYIADLVQKAVDYRTRALSLTLRAIVDLTTNDYESKDDFIQRVRNVLSVDPDSRL